MENSIKGLEGRIEKLEKDKQSKFRFFVQYLLSPLLVVAVGLMFNWQLEKDKKEIQQLQIAQTMLSTLFSEDKFKTLATKRLMDEVLESEKLKNEIGSIVEDYLTVKFNKSFEEGDYDSAQGILKATEIMGGSTGENIAKGIEKDKKVVLSKYQSARENELNGYKALVSNNFKLALEKFEEAYNSYPGLHSVSEIYHLLESSQNEFDAPETGVKIYREIVEKYSWKVPDDIIQALKSKI
ncbi:MAG: hypothetical protein KAJ62_00905 [Desulfobacteraceae bacterium]|nr:hypothetical protein [Desulfobacteraceae bacterium]